jgi:hypothetical protein
MSHSAGLINPPWRIQTMVVGLIVPLSAVVSKPAHPDDRNDNKTRRPE